MVAFSSLSRPRFIQVRTMWTVNKKTTTTRPIEWDPIINYKKLKATINKVNKTEQRSIRAAPPKTVSLCNNSKTRWWLLLKTMMTLIKYRSIRLSEEVKSCNISSSSCRPANHKIFIRLNCEITKMTEAIKWWCLVIQGTGNTRQDKWWATDRLCLSSKKHLPMLLKRGCLITIGHSKSSSSSSSNSSSKT